MKRFGKIVGISLLVLVTLAWYVRGLIDFRNQADFDLAVWREAPNCSPDGCDAKCVRGGMVRDLTRRHLQRGTGRADVLALLGNEGPARGRQQCLDYDLGMCSGFAMDYDSLIVCFDERDKITGAWTEQH